MFGSLIKSFKMSSSQNDKSDKRKAGQTVKEIDKLNNNKFTQIQIKNMFCCFYSVDA